jgi:hypothetical protein
MRSVISENSFAVFRTNREENNNWRFVPFVYRRMHRIFATGASHINLEGRTSCRFKIILGTGQPAARQSRYGGGAWPVFT